MRRLSGDLRRTELLEGAVVVLLEKGFAKATTRDLAAALGIGRGLIHHYFASFEELQSEAFARLAEDELGRAEAELAPLPPCEALTRLLDWLTPDPDDRHWRLWRDVWDEAQHDRALAELLNRLVERWRSLLAGVLRAGTAAGSFACADADGAAWRLLGAAEGLGGYLLLPGAALGRPEVLAHLARAAAAEVGRAVCALEAQRLSGPTTVEERQGDG